MDLISSTCECSTTTPLQNKIIPTVHGNYRSDDANDDDDND